MSEDFGNDIITLIDENGDEKEFEVIDVLEKGDNTYFALVPVFSNADDYIDSDGELVILKVIEDENGEEILSGIEDEQEFDDVWAEFESRLEENYDIKS